MDAEAKALIQQRAALDIEDRRDVLSREVANIKERMSMRGALQSGMTVSQIRDAVAREASIRTRLVWAAAARALSLRGESVTDSLAAELKGLIAALTREHSDDLATHFDGAFTLMGQNPRGSVEDSFQAAFDRINIEVDFALLSSRRVSPEADTPVVNIYQSQGIVQTGPDATASLTVHIGVEEKQEITLALSAVREALEAEEGLAEQERGNALELVEETVAELEKPEPNGLKVRSGLQGIATTIQALASAPQAYNLLKGAASLLGLDLP